MTRYFFDSTVASNIPSDAVGVCGYVDGAYRWASADWARFPNAVKVRIAVNPATNDGHCLDVEPGNWNAVASVDWVIMRRASGLATPTVYAGSWAPGYTWQDVLNAHAVRGVDPPLIWYANYDGIAVIPDGCVAKQYASSSMLGIDADVSVVADYWAGVDPAPEPVPVPVPQPIDPASALNRIKAGRALLVQAEVEFQAAEEDVTP